MVYQVNIEENFKNDLAIIYAVTLKRISPKILTDKFTNLNFCFLDFRLAKFTKSTKMAYIFKNHNGSVNYE